MHPVLGLALQNRTNFRENALACSFQKHALMPCTRERRARALGLYLSRFSGDFAQKEMGVPTGLESLGHKH